MNRSNLRESVAVGNGRNLPGFRQHLRGQSLTGLSNSKAAADENLDLFSKNRRTVSVASSDASSDVSVKLGRLSVGSAKTARCGIVEDLLSSADGGKHDYDWLLTPPGTPLFSSSDGSESQPTAVAPRRSSLARSVSAAKTSRLSVSQSETHHSSRPTRSSSVTRSSVSSSQCSAYSSNKSSSILNTSSASVSSYTRPASPITRSPSTARPSIPSTHSTPSRSFTPSRTRPAPASSSIEKTRPFQNSRPSTPSSKPRIPANLNSTTARSNSRPSTPTRRSPVPSLSPTSVSFTSGGRVVSNGRIPASVSRPSSPSPRVRPAQQPVVPPDFPLDAPPNLRTTLPDRPLSAGRSRPSLTVKANSEPTGALTAPRRHSSPTVTRGRLTEPPGKSRVHSNGRAADISESRKALHASELGMRKPLKSSLTATESTGFGRTISKKSLDVAIRHMDIKNGVGSNHMLSSTTLFPQSIRSATAKTQSINSLSAPEFVNNGNRQNGDVPQNGSHISRSIETESGANDAARLSEVDMYESSRYDAILLKEDLKNTIWLHSIDDKSDQGPVFDNGFEPLPEPFGIL